MSKTTSVLCAVALALCLASCTKKAQQTTTESTHRGQVAHERRTMDEYHLTDTAGSYVYELHRQPTDSVPAVHDEFGDVYVDNRYVLRISRAGNQFFCQEFTKRSFKSRLDKNFYENAIFDGFRFTKHEGGKLYFSVCVSYPDSDLSQPFILCVSPDGSFTIEQDNSPDLEA